MDCNPLNAWLMTSFSNILFSKPFDLSRAMIGSRGTLLCYLVVSFFAGRTQGDLNLVNDPEIKEIADKG